jgi:glycosyltransferase involved in cell wall biosynthesis
MILIDAVYINSSGGKVLLEYFLKEQIRNYSFKNVFYLFDKRLLIDSNIILNNTNYKILNNSEKDRKLFYKKNISNFNKIFCFANVPPPINLSNIDVFILFHNTLLLNSNLFFTSNILTSLQLYIKRQYIRIKNNERYKWIVQTPTVKNLLITNLNVKVSNIHILPFFYDEWPSHLNTLNIKNENNFLYVADGSTQKNHMNLFKAIEILPHSLVKSLNFYFTVPPNFKIIIKNIESLKKKGYNIYNYGYCSKLQLESLYKECNYLIFPSLTESFGLPLFEGAKAGCKVVTSDLPYVYDILYPHDVFNPNDPISISNTIIRLFNLKTKNSTKIIITNQINELFKIILC